MHKYIELTSKLPYLPSKKYLFGSLGAISEQSFEHAQSTSLKNIIYKIEAVRYILYRERYCVAILLSDPLAAW